MPESFVSPYANATPEEMEASLREEVSAALQRRYSLLPDPEIVRRVEAEWSALRASQTIPEAAALYELTLWLRRRGFPYWLCGSCGASLIFYLLGMTSANPLPAHYYCPQCRQVHWAPHRADGFDLPERRVCQEDSSLLLGDGHNMPWQSLWSGEDDFLPDGQYQMRLSSAAYSPLVPFLKNHWLRDLTPGGGAMEPYPNIRVVKLSCLSLVFTIDPKEACPDFHNVELNDSCVASALADGEALMNPDQDAGEPGVPLPSPRSFAELVYSCGLLHSAGVWDQQAAFMVERLGYSLPDLIAFRDDVFSYLQAHGFSSKDARQGMDQVRRGRGLPLVTDEMRAAKDKWVLSRCGGAEYLFSKAHIVEWIFYRLKAAGVRTCASSSYALLRKVLDGRDGLFLLAARPGMGKTAFALYLAEKLAAEDNKRVAMFVPRGSRAVVLPLVPPALRESRQPQIVIRDDFGALDGAVERLRSEGGFDFIIIDPLQQLSRRKRPRAEQLVPVMERLQRLSAEAEAPILVTSSLTRCPERRQDHFPRLSDVPLAEHLLPYTEAALLLYREAYYDDGADKSFALCDVQKYPCGVLNTIHLKWNSQRSAFEDTVNPGRTPDSGA